MLLDPKDHSGEVLRCVKSAAGPHYSVQEGEEGVLPPRLAHKRDSMIRSGILESTVTEKAISAARKIVRRPKGRFSLGEHWKVGYYFVLQDGERIPDADSESGYKVVGRGRSAAQAEIEVMNA